jgi:hypothetical protein
MTTPIERRVTRLEATTDRGDRCPECGWDGDPSKVEYVVEWQDPDGPTEPDEFCETCGRQLTCTVHMDWGGSA